MQGPSLLLLPLKGGGGARKKSSNINIDTRKGKVVFLPILFAQFLEPSPCDVLIVFGSLALKNGEGKGPLSPAVRV